jgi:uncharacterized protein YjbJ (UPF0337 family)
MPLPEHVVLGAPLGYPSFVPDDEDVEMTDAPATWENIVEGEAEKLVGELTGDKARIAEGEEQIEIAHEVREEWREQKEHRHRGD